MSSPISDTQNQIKTATGIRAVDLHSHFNHGTPNDNPTSRIYCADLPFLLEMYRYADIACGAFSTFASVINPAVIREENEYVFRMAQELPQVYQWVVVDPRQMDTFSQAERMLESEKCVGIKIHPCYHGYDITDYADSIFSFANERSTVVLTHPDNPEQLERIVPFADRYPNMRLILAHLGSVEHVSAIRKARYQNIYTDTSGCASINNHLLEYAVEQIGADRIFFGTDTYSSGFQRGRIEYAMISEEDKRKILRDNALTMFQKLEPDE